MELNVSPLRTVTHTLPQFAAAGAPPEPPRRWFTIAITLS